MLTDEQLRDVRNEIDGHVLQTTLEDILLMPPVMRDAAVKDFEAIDPDLGNKLRLSLYFVS